MKVKFKEFNNKSRKGTYLYVKDDKKAGRYYKYNVGDNIDGIVEYYRSPKKIGTLRQYKQEYNSVLSGERGKTSKVRAKAQRYKKKKGLGLKIGDVLNKGLGKAYIEDFNNASKKDLQLANELLLQNIVKDPEVRALVATEENMKKLAHRLQVNLIVKDAANKILDTIKAYEKTLEEIQEKTKKLSRGIEVTEKSGTPYNDLLKAIQLTNHDVQMDGILDKISAEILFRKN